MRASELPRFLRIGEVCELVGVSRTTIWRWVRSGHFPPKRQLGPNSVGWPAHEVEQWLVDRPTSA